GRGRAGGGPIPRPPRRLGAAHVSRRSHVRTSPDAGAGERLSQTRAGSRTGAMGVSLMGWGPEHRRAPRATGAVASAHVPDDTPGDYTNGTEISLIHLSKRGLISARGRVRRSYRFGRRLAMRGSNRSGRSATRWMAIAPRICW